MMLPWLSAGMALGGAPSQRHAGGRQVYSRYLLGSGDVRDI